jgi:DNA-binding GntR family transcriptional regulator
MGGINRNGATPINAQIAADLRRRVAAGDFGSGRLPSLRTLAGEYEVAEMTVQAAIRELQREGLLVTATGRGTFVRQPADLPAEGDSVAALRRDVDQILVRLADLERAAEVERS